ncbi:MAG: FAD-dependent oxidoreductase [Pseudomonadota bacterium]
MLHDLDTSSSRRTFLKLTAASATLAACSAEHGNRGKHVAVVGGGIIGASIAYHLAGQGVKVTLLERHGLAARASRGTFAWINATWAKQPRHYHAFNQAGLAGWKRLQSDLDMPVRWGGSLEWFPAEARQARLAKQIAEQVTWGEPAEMVGPDVLRQLEPNVDFGVVERVAYSPNDGAVDPVLATRLLAGAAQRAGATVRENCSVEGVSAIGDETVTLHTTCGDINVDSYVLATGADPAATGRLAGLAIPQRTTPGVIVVTKPMDRLINRIIVAPGVHIHQRNDGRIVLGEQGGAPDTTAHQERLHDRPTRFPDAAIAAQHAGRILGQSAKFVPGIGAAVVEDVIIGWRPLPIDGHPVLGRSPERPACYLAIMHSGVSLAPVVGDLVAREIALGRQAPGLEGYRPDRSFQEVARY